MIRLMEIADIDGLADVYYNIFTSSDWNYDWLRLDNTLRYLTDMFNSPMFRGYVFLLDNKFMGGCFGDISDYFIHNQYYIKEIFIIKELQRKGYGSAFLSEIERDLKGQGIMSVTLLTSMNTPAYGFYQRNGYTRANDTAFMAKVIK